ncbi:MAG: V-type ATP synthase subunit F [archaeon]|nr:V-type ATP synthase subunit F [archaeon]MCP8313277.1 V-type ATP synthase subunit F [archaeon]MCP8319482.1 V-type ATP synthase subunit F [archaeon]
MRVIAIGKRSFVTGFRLAGIPGIEVKTPDDALKEIKKMVQNKEIGLIIVGDDVARPVRRKLTDIKAKQPIPLIYELPAPGSPQEKIEYRTLLRSILKMG